MFFYRLFILLLFGIDKSTSLKCYSCGDKNEFLGQQYATPLPCEEFEKSDSLDTFIIDCPEEYMGCITQAKDNEVMRTCDTLAIDDCETANGVTYCYCSQDLCNGKQSHVDAHKASRDVINYPSDDEDYGDMSGHGHPSDDENEDDNGENVTDRNGRSKNHANKNSSSQRINSTGNYFIVLSVQLIFILLITSMTKRLFLFG